MKKILLNHWTALLTLILVVAVRIEDPSFVESIRLRYFDTLITSKPITENNIYSVNIDEESLDKYGQWPFSRDVYGQIIEELYKRNAGLVVFNVLMPEKDRLGGDQALSKTLSQYPVIIPSIASTKGKNTPHNTGAVVIGADNINQVVEYPGLISAIDSIGVNAAGVGIVNTLPEIDGVNRRLPLVSAVNGVLYPALSLEVVRVIAGDSTFQVKLNEFGVEKMRIPSFGSITTDPLGRVWIDWSQSNKGVSLTSLPDDFGGAIVIVGPTAAGISNPIATAKGSIFPNDVQASIIGTMLNNVVINRPDYADGAEILTIAASGVLLLFLARWVYVGLGAVVVLVTSSIVGSQYAYSEYLLLFDASAVTVGLILVALHAYGVKFVSEFLQKQQIKKQFGTYLNAALVEKLQKNPELLHLGGESRELSILFSDVRGFTSISEHYGEDVQGLTKIMNRYMTAMTASILKNEGTLDKYIGDAKMAFWNAPIEESNHAKNAVKTALEMLENLKDFNNEIEKDGVPPFGMGLGINTATVVVGNMGSVQRFDYTCLGDGVNLASRLEGQSKQYGVKVILGPKTAKYVSDEYLVIELDKIAVKGKKEGVTIFTVLGRLDNYKFTDNMVKNHNRMLELYRNKRWVDAEGLCIQLKGKAFNKDMDHYYEMMIARIAEYENHDEFPDVWDGVFVATSK